MEDSRRDVLEAQAETGAGIPLALGPRDRDSLMREPARLFGRARELATLEKALDQASAGAVVFALVTGSSGVGKSALVYALRDRARERQAMFAAGKLDQLQRGTAYEALSQALRSVVRRRLAEPPDARRRWEEAFRGAAGPNARLLIDLVPELSPLLGEPQALPELDPALAKARLQQTVQRFVRAASTADHPLLLFIDDLQWASRPSLDLLREIILDPAGAYLMVVIACRESEMPQAHWLHTLAAAAADCGRGVPTIALGPLDDEAVTAMIGDRLGQTVEGARELSALVKAKTDGNPLFVEQLLRGLRARNLLRRDPRTGRSSWDAGEIKRAGLAGNVIGLLTAAIAALPDAARHALSLGACIGARFEVGLLAASSGIGAPALRELLDGLVAAGLLAPDEEHETYAFAHDRAQQAAYDALDEDARARAHLALARALERQGGWESRDDELFAMLDHYLRSLSLSLHTEAWRHMAALFLRGGQRAAALLAFEQAVSFLRIGAALLGEQGWEEAYELAFETQLALAGAEWLAGHLDVGESLFLDLKMRARERLERARVVIAWVPLLMLSARYQACTAVSVEMLEDLGFSFPTQAQEQERLLVDSLSRLAPKIAATSVEAWRAMPRCKDPEQALVGRLLCTALLAVSTADISPYPRLPLLVLEHTFAHGTLPESMYAMALSMLAFAATGYLDEAVKCGELALAMRDAPDIAKSSAMYCVFLGGQYVMPVDRVLALWRELPELCEREGNLSIGDIAHVSRQSLQMIRGIPISNWDVPTRPLRSQLAREVASLTLARRDALRGTAPAKPMLSSASEPQGASPLFGFISVTTASYLALHLGEDAEALRLIMSIDSPRNLGTFGPADIRYLFTLSVLHTMSPPDETGCTDARRKEIEHQRARLARYAEKNPTTFRHMQLLAKAGTARAVGEHDEAKRLYAEGIDDARHNGFVNHEALGLRLLGELHLALGQPRLARAHLHEAHNAYIRWGALAAADALRVRHPELFAATASAPPPTRRSALASMIPEGAASDAGGIRPDLIDAATMIHATQAIAGEIILDKLIDRLMHLVIKGVGAERAALILKRGQSLRIEAEASVHGGTNAPAQPPLLDESATLPRAIVQYVAHTHERVVLDDASADETFRTDAYIDAHKPRSLVCMPLLRQGDLKGVLYLESHRAANAFTAERMQLLGVLCSQAAISIESATLYADLERLVAERTRELRDAQVRVLELEKEATEVQMAGGFAHEMRNTLTGAKIFLGRVLGNAKPEERASLPVQNSRKLQELYLQLRECLPEDMRTCTAVALREVNANEEAIDTALHDVDDTLSKALASTHLILDYARLGRERRGTDAVHVRALIDFIFRQLRGELDAQGIAVTLDIEPDCVLIGNETHFHSILRNLILNARDALLEKPEPALRALRVSAFKEQQRCTLLVADTGAGIPPELRAKIFDPFFSTKPKGGTGLGLGVVRKLVLLYQGKIELESELGAGTTFRVSLPLAEPGPSANASRISGG